MGFTVEDMLIISREKYNMELIAGKNGWANSISWLLMAEDTIIVNSVLGKELVVTTGLGFNTKEKLIDLRHMLSFIPSCLCSKHFIYHNQQFSRL